MASGSDRGAVLFHRTGRGRMRAKGMTGLRTVRPVVVVVLAFIVLASPAAAQTLVGALAIDERQGDQYGWAVDYQTPAAAQGRALQECGPGCSVVLTFGRCAAYAADQDADSTAVGWAEAYGSADAARQAALGECRARGGGSGCIVRAWGCNSPVVEERLNLDGTARRQIQQGLATGGFDPGGADGLFGPRTRAAIRRWQSSRGVRATGYLDGASAEALRTAGGAGAAVAGVAPSTPPAAATTQALSAPSAELDGLFWQSIMNSMNPAEFEAYLAQFPNGAFRALAQVRLAALRGSSSDATTVTFRPDQTCAGQPAGATCWQEISRRPGCYVWNQNRQPGSTVTWPGQCTGGLAQGTGTLTWVWDDNQEALTGRLQDGKHTGHWILRHADGGVSEGPYVDSERNGHWTHRFADGTIAEGPYVDDEMHGHWVVRSADGDVQEGPFVGDERDGRWTLRWADGTVEEWLFRDGERVP